MLQRRQPPSPPLNKGNEYTMHDRQNELHQWLLTLLGDTPFTLVPLAGDASFRRYFRLHCAGHTQVVMDAPPEKETITPFVDIGNKLAAIGVHTPAIHAVEPKLGFILLEDLGDQLLLPALTEENADILYKSAMTTLIELQKLPCTENLPAFDKPFMLKETSLFLEWFVKGYLEIDFNTHDLEILNSSLDWLTNELTTQPTLFIHRDYHARNLILIDPNNPQDMGVIDFQDAMVGPVAYDLVSLLKDCYIQWPRARVVEWVTFFYHHQAQASSMTLPKFIRAFDLCGLQRHLKVLGVFSRLHLRDNKPNYLRDLPLTFQYVNDCLDHYEELHPLKRLLQEKVSLPFAEKCR